MKYFIRSLMRKMMIWLIITTGDAFHISMATHLKVGVSIPFRCTQMDLFTYHPEIPKFMLA